MPSTSLRRATAFSLLALLTMFGSGCRQRDGETVNVSVIGPKPELVDPAGGLVHPGDEVLLSSVAQGLVLFDARGEIEPGLAERWNVSDDGLSYIFRLANANWPSGRPITAKDVVRLFKRQIAPSSRNSIKDAVGAIDEVVAMTDRVIEIRLLAPRPNLLQLLAQPEFALLRDGEGSGPFRLSDKPQPDNMLRLSRELLSPDGGTSRREVVLLSGAPAAQAIRAFTEHKTNLVLGGNFADLPLTRNADIPRAAFRFDPVAGLFGLVPARKGGPLGERDVRNLLNQAIDRDALVAALIVPDLAPRATVLQPGLDGLGDPVAPSWQAEADDARRARLIAEANRLFGSAERPVLRVALPEGPGARILLDRLGRDWAPLGIRVAPAAKGIATDLRLIDAVAPSTSPAWFLRQFRCEMTPICDPKADDLLDAARAAPIAAQRSALLAEAARMIDDGTLFFALAAPVRWSLVSPSISGFAMNRFGRHPLTGLQQKLSRERSD
jgi:oligopeptide transport system substrate-binding protein